MMQRLPALSIKNFLPIVLLLQIYCISVITSTKILQEIDTLLNTNNLFSGVNIRNPKAYFGHNDVLRTLVQKLDDPVALGVLHTKFQNKYRKNAKVGTGNSTIFKERILEIATHNLRTKQGFHLYEKGINQFTDMGYEPETFTSVSQPPPSQTRSSRAFYPLQPTPWFPHLFANRDSESTSLDWRNYGAVSIPKNQGRCGSCSFFATVGALESHDYLVKMASASGMGSSSASYTWGSPPDLSEQELLDCAGNYSGYRGCNDNLPTTGLEYMKQNGLSFEWDYPYQDKVGSYCYGSWNYKKIKLDGYYPVIPSHDEERLKQVVKDFGPVIAGMHMNLDLKMYKTGIYDQQCTDPHGISHNIYRNHMVVIVGYGSEWVNNRKIDFWTVKNSYGPNWGDRGYFRIVRNKRLCLLAEEAYYLYTRSPHGLSL